MPAGSVVARRYARALFEAAEAAGAAVNVGRDLEAVVGALWGDERLRLFFLSERAPAGAKKRLVEELSGDAGEPIGARPKTEAKARAKGAARGVHPYVRNFLLLVVDKRREAFVPDMAREYAALVDRAQGLTDVQVRTAVPLGKKEQDALLSTLTAKLGRQVRLIFAVDPALLGGVRIKVDDKLFDASLKRRLERLREHLAKPRAGA